MDTKPMALKARLRAEGEIILSLHGRCMDPLLITGDQAKIVPMPDYSIGQLCLFALPDGSLAVHRLIGRAGGALTMKGDRTRRFETVAYGDVIGVVSEIRLANCPSWSPAKQNHLTKIMVAHISGKLAKDRRREGKENLFQAARNKLYSKMLIRVSALTRKRWEKKCERQGTGAPVQ